MPLVAARLFGEGLRLVDDEPSPRRQRFLLGRAKALGQLREMAEANAVVRQAHRRRPHARRRATAKPTRCSCSPTSSRRRRAYDAADTRLAQLIALFERLGDDAAPRRSAAPQGHGLASAAGSRRRLRHRSREALALFRELGDRRGEAWALQHLSWCAFIAGRLEEAEELLHTSAATFAELGDAGGLGWAMGLLAYTRFHEGFAEEAEAMAEDVLAEGRERGDRWGAGMMLVLTATIRLWTGRTETRGDSCSRSGGDVRVDGRSLLARCRRGCRSAVRSPRSAHADEAFEVLEGVRRHADTGIPDQPKSFFLGGILGTAIHLGDVERAEALAEIVPDVAVGSSDSPVVNGERETALGLLDLMPRPARRGRGTARPAVAAPRSVERQRLLEERARARLRRLRSTRRRHRARRRCPRATPRASYLDRLTAGTARGLALARIGDAAAIDALAAVRDEADATEDRVAPRPGPPRREHRRSTPSGATVRRARADADQRLTALGVRRRRMAGRVREAAGVAALGGLTAAFT